ncbi:MAG TPA: glucosidase, partial [Gammaproteobacteria bacterium]
MTKESARLEEARTGKAEWRKWGPYLSERQWGTVREDYSDSGDAWNYFSHDQARSRAYHWGEDGLAGISDDEQRLCFALALWNGKDPILKERLFGLTNSEGNHGEDVKEYYFYLDSTPTHSYMKYLYKYPQRAYPYEEIVRHGKERGRRDMEYELIDTGVFDGDRYFDVFVEYAKASPEDVLVAITVANRGPEAASLHVLPTVWFRNTWSWPGSTGQRPLLRAVRESGEGGTLVASHPQLGERYVHNAGPASWLFTENETNSERLGLGPNASRYVKDGINDHVVQGSEGVINPEKCGTKAAAHYTVTVAPGRSETIRLRLCDADANGRPRKERDAFADFDALLEQRRMEADAFYATVIPRSLSPDAARVMRQALAGMLWSKQFYLYDVSRWLTERGAARDGRPASRNDRWRHMRNADIISMPDKWEYPWYAAWDLAFHVLALTLVDDDFGKDQLDVVLRGSYLHPS